jgi:hypothetical protein
VDPGRLTRAPEALCSLGSTRAVRSCASQNRACCRRVMPLTERPVTESWIYAVMGARPHALQAPAMQLHRDASPRAPQQSKRQLSAQAPVAHPAMPALLQRNGAGPGDASLRRRMPLETRCAASSSHAGRRGRSGAQRRSQACARRTPRAPRGASGCPGSRATARRRVRTTQHWTTQRGPARSFRRPAPQ